MASTLLSSPLLANKVAAPPAPPETDPDDLTRGTAKEIAGSLRFRSEDDSYLNRAVSTTGNTRNWTVAFWWKCAYNGVENRFFGSHASNTSKMQMVQLADGTLNFYDSWPLNWNMITTGKFRDNGAWYHICVAHDANNYISTERIKIWVNGKRITEFDTASYPGQSQECSWNKASSDQWVGTGSDTTSGIFQDGYLTDFYNLDGYVGHPADFTFFDWRGILHPKAFGMSTVNDGTTWSGKISGSIDGSYPKENTFDGNIDSYCYPSAGGTATFEFDDLIPCNELRIFCRNDANGGGITIDDHFQGDITTTPTWHVFQPKQHKLKKISWHRASSGSIGCQVYMIEIDGKVLIDGATDAAARNNLNADTDFVGQCSATGAGIGSGTYDNAFDGNHNSYIHASHSNGTLHWKPSSNITGRLRVCFACGARGSSVNGQFDFKISGTSYFDHGKFPYNKTLWVDFGTKTITSADGISWGVQGNNDWMAVRMIEFDHHILLDNKEDNSFHLEMANVGAITTDTLGNGSFTANNFTTSGTDIDYVVDSPSSFGTDSGAGNQLKGNYAILNYNNFVSTDSSTLSNGNLTYTGPASNSNYGYVSSTIGVNPASTTGYYCEFTFEANKNGCGVGFWDPQNHMFDKLNTQYPMGNDTANGEYGVTFLENAWVNSFGVNNQNGPTWGNGDVVQLAIKSNKIWIGVNNTWHGSGNPAAGSNETRTVASTVKLLVPFVQGIGESSARPIVHCNFGQKAFVHSAPTGFKSYCASNIAGLEHSKLYYDSLVYEGTASSRSVNRIAFKPDLVWFKNCTDSSSNWLFDVVRGTTKVLESDTNAAETTESTSLTAFNTDGFTISSDNEVNGSNDKMIAYMWDAGTATSGANNSGTINIASGDQWVNTTSGFSITKYTGTGADATFGHGLGAKPEFLMCKCMSVATKDWTGQHIGATLGSGRLIWNEAYSNDTSNADTYWNSTAPTSTLISIGDHANVNSSGATHICYAWTPIEGYSSFGTYTGSGSTPFIHLNFKPRFFMWKRLDNTASWYIIDTAHQYNSVVNHSTKVNQDGAEQSYQLTFFSNGVEVMSSGDGDVNGDGTPYIYAAFAEHPLKQARAF